MNKTISRLAERVTRNPRFIGVTGFEFTAAPRATVDVVEDAEERLGFALPEMLRRAYLEVANGGFGPGYGVMGVDHGFTDDLKHTAVDLYGIYRTGDPEDPTWNWPRGLLPICHWGCVIYSAVDCTAPRGPVSFVDVSSKEPGAPMSSITIPHEPSLQQWFDDWLDGKDLWKEVWGTAG